MATYVSPGVYIREFDFSQYVVAISTTVFAIVGTAKKGAVDERILITNEQQLIEKVGTPSADIGYGVYAAIQYLRRGSQLWYVRVANEATLETASVTLANSSGNTITMTAESAGTWAEEAGLYFTVEDGTDPGKKFVKVYLDEIIQEQFDNLSTDPMDDNFWETVFEEQSQLLDAEYLVADNGQPDNGTYTLAGGNNGVDGITDADYIGVQTPNGATGLQLFANPEAVDINMLAIPGISSGAVINSIITLCELRGDVLGLIDPPFGFNVQDVVDWHNGVGFSHAAFVSNKAALYWPWVRMPDAYNATETYIPPSGIMAQVMAYTDQSTETWFAPAGLTRGRLFEALEVEYSATQGERDYMYGPGNGNAVNPIVDFTRDGINVWGQRTLQRMPSSLDRVNVRRLLFFIEKSIAISSRFLVFDQNDEILWERFKNLVTPFLESIAARRGLEDFQVVADESTTTAFRRNNNEMNAKVMLIPTKSAEKIIIDFALFASGATFAEPSSF